MDRETEAGWRDAWEQRSGNNRRMNFHAPRVIPCKTPRRNRMRSKALIAGLLVATSLISGCANMSDEDAAAAVLIGAAAIGLGILAAGDDDGDDYSDDRYSYRGSRYEYERPRHRSHYERSRYSRNGRCDDARYNTSNGGRAETGTDEWDCSRYGDGLK